MSRWKVSLLALAGLLLLGMWLTPHVQAGSNAPAVPETAVSLQTEPTDSGSLQDGTGLFEGLGTIFAVLGIYVVTMFTMAIGTEIVVDIIKVTIGLKSKPTARDTLAKYEHLLPGTLDDLGASVQAQARLQSQIRALNEILMPAFQAEDTILQLRHEQFAEAFRTAFGDRYDELGDDWVASAASLIKQQVRTAVTQWDRRTTLGTHVTEQLLGELDDLIDAAAATTAARVNPDQLFAVAMTAVNGRLAAVTTAWTEQQLNSLRDASYESAKALYDVKIKPQIANAGLSPDIQAEIMAQFDAFLENLRVLKQGEIYLDALNRLLMDLERERNEIYSRLRIWSRNVAAWFWRLFNRIFSRNPNLDELLYMQHITINHPNEAASKLMAIDERDKQEATFRVNAIRSISVLIAIILAYLLKVDSADLLRGLFPGGADFLFITLVRSDSSLLMWINNTFHITAPELTAGVLLTGLGASAGSGFWHDQLTRLQNVKQGVDAVEATLQPIIVQARGNE